ncbi:MAG: type II secretion system F family protein, partial [Methanophagales archaeon]|nr:type II secretion system F family protein [Methanophagales archaeon]
VASGLTLMKSIEVEAKAGKGGIYKEIKKMHRNIEWGAEVSDAFKMFANAVKVPALTRVVTMLSEVLRAGGNLTEALSISAKDAEMERNLAKERSVNMLIYVIIVYIAFFVFIGIVYMLFKNLFPPLFEAFSTSGGVGIGAAGLGGGLNKEEITGILTQAAVFQSIFCGLMAGQMEAGNILAGLKHTLVMLLATWILFYFVI